MGGIAGIICSTPVAQEGIQIILEKMLKSMHHRGPDDKGTAFTPYGGFGHTRLGIIDIRGGQQPFYHPEKPNIVVLNGHIANYQALRSKLEAKGVDFITRSDVEVLMMMYDYYDEDMFRQLEGMYSFALWNGEKQELLLARDPLGKKPLYYEMDEHGIAFASELKAILQARQSKPSLNPVAMQHYLALQYTPSPMTMFNNIFKLPPGYMLRWRVADKSLEIWPIWVPDDDVSQYITQNKNLSLDDALKELDQRFRHSVELAVTATDVPAGIFLSGGLGASVLAAQAKELAQYPIETYSIGYRDVPDAFSDKTYAERVAQVLGTSHHHVEIGAEALDQLPRILWFLDEPIADPALMAMDALAAKAGESLKVVLSGQGANEIFGGYSKYSRYKAMLRLNQMPGIAKKLAAMGLSPFLPMLGWDQAQLVSGIFNNGDPLAIWQTYRNFPELERKKLLKNPKDLFPDKRFRFYAKGAFDPYVQLQWDDLHHWLPHDLLLGLDKMTMAHSLEARTPYLEPNLAAWALGLPEWLKWHGKTSKYLLREYAKKMLPADIAQRQKVGFEIPLDAWLYERMSYIGPCILDGPLLSQTDFLSRPYIEKLLKRYEAGQLKSAQPVWNLLVLAIWYQVYTTCDSKDNLWDIQPLGKRL